MRKKHYSLLMKLSLLSISFVLTSSVAISSSIPVMIAEFPEQSVSSIELLSTIPAMMVVVFVLLSNIIASYIGKKQTVILGLLVALVSSIVPVLSSSYILILLSRMGLGVGFGLFNGFAVSLIVDFFNGGERAAMIGFQGAFQGLGSSVMTLVSGYLLQVNWHLAFTVYWIIAPITLLFIFFVPNPEPALEITKEDRINKQHHFKELLVPNFWGYIFLLVVIMMVYMTVVLKVTNLLLEYRIGTTKDGSYMLTVLQVGTLLAGILFSYFLKGSKAYLFALSCLVMGIAFILIFFSRNLWIIGLSSFLTGASMSTVISYVFHRTSFILSTRTVSIGTSLVIVACNLGNFLSPYGIAFFSSFAETLVEPILSPFLVGAMILIVIAFINAFAVLMGNEEFQLEQETED